MEGGWSASCGRLRFCPALGRSLRGLGEFHGGRVPDLKLSHLALHLVRGATIVGQTRRRKSWKFGSRTLSGVTGITGIGETCSDPIVDRVAQDAILVVDAKPHGIFGVDMTYDQEGFPNPTEINIGRFFTTHYFFTEAGLNMPEFYCDLALEGKFPTLERKINPLTDGLVWIRGMDVTPVLTTTEQLEKMERRAL